MNRPLAWAGALRRASSWLIEGRTSSGRIDIDERKGVGGRFDSADIHFLELLDVAEDVAQLLADLLLFLGREGEAGEVGYVFYVNFDGGHGWVAGLRSLLVELAVDEGFQFGEGLGASWPWAWTVTLLPGPAASIIRPMMLLPLTFSPSFSTKMSQLNRLAVLTNMAAGRAWMPSLFDTMKSLVIVALPIVIAFALIRSCDYNYPKTRGCATEFYSLAAAAMREMSRSLSSLAGL